MADPYDTLGIGAFASPAEAEAAYHRLLLACHPDLHAAEGPEAVARAEARTREINDAIQAIRHGHRPRARVPHTEPARHDPWPTSDERESVHEPVPCPFCGTPVTTLGEFESHLDAVHHLQAPRPFRRSRSASRPTHGASYGASAVPPRGPAPTRFVSARVWWPVPLWLVAVADLAAVLLVIAVVAAMGGHWAVLRDLSADAPTGCAAGSTIQTRFGTTRCDPNQWIWVYLLVGMVPTAFVALWRVTTRGRD
jgi:hypothetical protein